MEMTANVSADGLDFVQIDRKLIERAIEALERAKCAGLESRDSGILYWRPHRHGAK